MNADKVEQLKELQKKLYQEEKARKRFEDNITGVYKLTASLLTCAEMIDYYGEKAIEFQKQINESIIRGLEATANRKDIREAKKHHEEMYKAMRLKNKNLKAMMKRVTISFDNDEVMTSYMEDVLDRTVEFYDEAITYESVKPLLNRTK
jgi:hypothetical protein